MKKFAQNDSLLINGRKFTVVKISDCAEFPGTQKLIGTYEGDPSFLAGKRTIFSAYLVESKSVYFYDHAAN